MDIEKKIENVLNNEYLLVSLALFTTVYASMSRVTLPKFLVKLFKNDLFRVFYLSLLLMFNFNKAPHLAIIIAIIFVVTLNFISQEEHMDGNAPVSASVDISTIANTNAYPSITQLQNCILNSPPSLSLNDAAINCYIDTYAALLNTLTFIPQFNDEPKNTLKIYNDTYIFTKNLDKYYSAILNFMKQNDKLRNDLPKQFIKNNDFYKKIQKIALDVDPKGQIDQAFRSIDSENSNMINLISKIQRAITQNDKMALTILQSLRSFCDINGSQQIFNTALNNVK
jgi:hypothetical protein